MLLSRQKGYFRHFSHHLPNFCTLILAKTNFWCSSFLVCRNYLICSILLLKCFAHSWSKRQTGQCTKGFSLNMSLYWVELEKHLELYYIRSFMKAFVYTTQDRTHPRMGKTARPWNGYRKEEEKFELGSPWNKPQRWEIGRKFLPKNFFRLTILIDVGQCCKKSV